MNLPEENQRDDTESGSQQEDEAGEPSHRGSIRTAEDRDPNIAY